MNAPEYGLISRVSLFIQQNPNACLEPAGARRGREVVLRNIVRGSYAIYILTMERILVRPWRRSHTPPGTEPLVPFLRIG